MDVMVPIIAMHVTQLTYFWFTLQEFSMVGVTWRTSKNHKTVKIGDACVGMGTCPGQFGISANNCQYLSFVTSCYGRCIFCRLNVMN